MRSTGHDAADDWKEDFSPIARPVYHEPMARRTFQAIACLLFGFVPVTIGFHRIGAERLPSSLIAHFNSAGTPSTWITKTGLLELYLGCVVLIALAGSATAFLTPKNWKPDFTS